MSKEIFSVEAFDEDFDDNLFEAIGFEVVEDDDFFALFENADRLGAQSLITRGDLTLQGKCWKVGEGLEVWAWLCSSGKKVHYEDCRPAFRSRYAYLIAPWELIEYEESGDAILRGNLQDDTEVIFQLQNITELNSHIFHHPHLHVAFAGLAYSAVLHSGSYLKRNPPLFELAEKLPELAEDAYESDYMIRGRVLAWKYLKNPVTENDLVWLHVDVGKFRMEILANRHALPGRLKIGAAISARIWLQGHILDIDDLEARYEGVDRAFEIGDFWGKLQRGN